VCAELLIVSGFLERQKIRQELNQKVWNMLESADEKDALAARGMHGFGLVHSYLVSLRLIAVCCSDLHAAAQELHERRPL
jgi:hypothetical protein